MTANDLYKMEPLKRTNEVEILAGYYYNHVPEAGDDFESNRYSVKSDRVEIRYIKDWCFDGRRVWVLATVWFDGSPVMVIQNAGREGDDHSKRFITDKELFSAMCCHLMEISGSEEKDQTECFDPDLDIKELTSFYGNDLYGEFKSY